MQEYLTVINECITKYFSILTNFNKGLNLEKCQKQVNFSK